MPRVLVYVALVSVLSGIALAQMQPENAEPIDEQLERVEYSKSNPDEETFKRLFIQRRKDHFDAVKSLRSIGSYERLYKVVSVLFDKLFEVIEYSKRILYSASYVPGESPFPKNDTVKDALSNILENTALFGDIVLQLPEVTQRILKTQQTWNTTIRWAITFINQTNSLLDKPTAKVIHYMGQELNLTEREAGYFNPFFSNSNGRKTDEDSRKKKSSSKKEKRRKGPQMVKIEL